MADTLPRSLPRGPHELDATTVAASQRARLLDAITAEVGTRGYAATTVAAVIKRAGVSRKTFYEQFTGKEDCFLAAFDEGRARLSAAITAATLAAGDDPMARLHAGYGALCAGLAAEPAFAYAFAIASPAAGEAVQARRLAWREASIARLRLLYASTPKAGHDLPAALPPAIARAIVGAVEALICAQLEAGAADSLTELVPTIVSVARALMFNSSA